MIFLLNVTTTPDFAMLNCLHVVSALCTHGRCNSYAIWVNLVALQQKIYLLITIQSSSIDSLYHINIFPSLIEEDRLCVMLTDD